MNGWARDVPLSLLIEADELGKAFAARAIRLVPCSNLVLSLLTFNSARLSEGVLGDVFELVDRA